MDDYVMQQARFAGDVFSNGILARIHANWQARRATAKLLNLSDCSLSDIGMKRADVAWAAHQPLNVNATTVLAERMRRA